MPHIYASEESDGYFGLGYATAEDRLVPVLFSYLLVRGELAKYFGKEPIIDLKGVFRPTVGEPIIADPISSDLAALSGRYLADARENFHKLPRTLQRDMRSYVGGFRAYMREHRAEVPPWAPELESALPLALLAYELGTTTPTPCTSIVRMTSQVQAPSPPHPMEGSNAWALGPSKSANGGTLFAADSHGPAMTFAGPTFYLWRLRTPTLDIFALGLPGTATAIMGHSQQFAWAWTEGPRATADCYAVQTVAGKPRRYLFDGREHGMELVNSRIEVKAGKTIRQDLEYTNHNGVRSPVVWRDGRMAYVVSNAYMGRAGFISVPPYQLAKANDRSQLRTALELRDWYPANLLIGGRDGTLLYTRPGRIPRRPVGSDPQKLLDGNSSRTAWAGFHTFAEAVQLWNPPQGFIANANVSPDMMYGESVLKAQDYPSYFYFEPGQTNTRQRRLIELLEHASQVSVQGAMEIAFDVRMPDAEKWGPAIAQAIAAQDHDANSPLGQSSFPTSKPFLDDLTHFDGAFGADSRGALEHTLLRVLLAQRATPDTDAMAEAIESDRALATSMQRTLVKAVADVFKWMQQSGPCGVGHTLGDVFRVGRGALDFPFPGISFPSRSKNTKVDSTLIGTAYGSRPKTCRQFLTGGSRAPFVVNFGPDVQSYSAFLWGASEDPASPHFSDQSRLFSERRLRPNWFEPKDLSSHVVSMRVLSTRTGRLISSE